MSTTNTEDSMRWGDPHRGVMLDKLTVWREADGSVVFLVPEGRSQLSFSAEEWARAVEFLDGAVEAESSHTSAE